MPSLQVVSSQPNAGKSTIVVGLAQAFARDGRRVRMERLGSGPAAGADATTFAGFLFASSSGQPLTRPPQPNGDEVVVIEADAGAEPLAGVPAVVATHGAPTDADKALATSLEDRLLGTIAVAVDPGAVEAVARDLTNGGLRPLALLPEDLTLAAPSVSEIGEALGATVLHAAENADEVVEDVLIGPVYADPARPLFRRFAHKAILAPFNKTDLHLAAIETEAACLVITGGQNPSPYIIDRAQHGNTTLLLAPKDTPGTVAALGSVWSRNRFRGESKAAAALLALESRLDVTALLKKLDA
jgi:BioD-like phosphotransacetylase family protein